MIMLVKLCFNRNIVCNSTFEIDMLLRMVRLEEIMKREWLSHLRKYKGMTQQQVAFSSFIDRSYYSQLESGKRNPSVNVAKNIAKVLDFDPLLFFQDVNISSPEHVAINIDIYDRFKKLD